MKPNLTKEISIIDFKDYYWLKEELQIFCRDNGLSASGSKLEISERIVTFLQTGEIKKPQRKTKNKAKYQEPGNLSLDTLITEVVINTALIIKISISQGLRWMRKRIHNLFVYAHPSKESFTRSVLEEFLTGLEKSGNTYELSDIYRMNVCSDMKILGGNISQVNRLGNIQKPMNSGGISL